MMQSFHIPIAFSLVRRSFPELFTRPEGEWFYCDIKFERKYVYENTCVDERKSKIRKKHFWQLFNGRV